MVEYPSPPPPRPPPQRTLLLLPCRLKGGQTEAAAAQLGIGLSRDPRDVLGGLLWRRAARGKFDVREGCSSFDERF